MRKIEIFLGRFVRREIPETRSEVFTPDEQLVLEIFAQSKAACNPEIALGVWEIRGKAGPSYYHLIAEEVVHVTETLEERGYLEVLESAALPQQILYRRITDLGKVVVKQIRQQQGRFHQPLAINMPVEVKKASKL